MPRPILMIILSLAIAQSTLALSHTAIKTERLASIKVRVADLDLRNDAHVQMLLGRLEQAAVKACGGNPKSHRSYELMPHYTTKVFRDCQHDAIARAVATIDAPKLSAAFAAASRQAVKEEWAHLTPSSDARPKAGT
jgi:UrcA family protein